MASMVDNVKPAPPRVRDRDEEGGWLSRPGAWWRNGRTFLTEVRNELKRVTWPTRKEVYATTLVVILTSFFFGLYLFAIDYFLGSLVNWIFRRFGAA
jgi:preprotein translocase subunit SecE